MLQQSLDLNLGFYYLVRNVLFQYVHSQSSSGIMRRMIGDGIRSSTLEQQPEIAAVYQEIRLTAEAGDLQARIPKPTAWCGDACMPISACSPATVIKALSIGRGITAHEPGRATTLEFQMERIDHLEICVTYRRHVKTNRQ
jgi:hypothetical protein